MQFKDSIINTALLGTERKTISVQEMPDDLQGTAAIIIAQNTSKEQQFLDTAALALNYYKAGYEPLPASVEANEAVAETLPYCSDKAANLLATVLESKFNTLIRYWAYFCAKRNLLVQPHLLPDYFVWGNEVKKQALPLFVQTIGNRGKWLSKLYPEWGFVNGNSEQFDWETANNAARVAHLGRLRLVDAPAALGLVSNCWKEENANNRAALLGALATNISKNDEPFLLEVLGDKSVKVKEEALELLKLIADSPIMKSYERVVAASIQVSQSKMLGLISRTNVTVALKVDDNSIFDTGIEKLSSDKKVSDDVHVLSQLIEEIHPDFWKRHLGMDEQQIIKLFAERDELKGFQLALSFAISKFKCADFAKLAIKQWSPVSVLLLSAIPEEERISYAEVFVPQALDDVIAALRNDNFKEWGLDFSKKLVTALASNPTKYNKQFFESICVYLPAGITAHMDVINHQEEWAKSYWAGINESVKNQIAIKEDIKQAFV